MRRTPDLFDGPRIEFGLASAKDATYTANLVRGRRDGMPSRA